MKISVTQHHIDVGLQGSCSSDPIALAMRDAGLERPHVGPTHISWRVGFKDFSVETPEEVLEFMKIFDNSPRLSRPLDFSLESV